jgi:outer membrane protein W
MKTVFSLVIVLFSLGIRAQSNTNPYNLVLEKYIDTYLTENKGLELDVIYVLTDNLKQTIVKGDRNISIKIVPTKQLLNGNINSVWEIMPILTR